MLWVCAMVAALSVEHQGFDKGLHLSAETFEGEQLLFKFQQQVWKAEFLHFLFKQYVVEVCWFAELGDQEDHGVSPRFADLFFQTFPAGMAEIVADGRVHG